MNGFPAKEQIRCDDPRVPLAAERTLLAWVRTGLALMGLGFVVARFGLFLREVAMPMAMSQSSGYGPLRSAAMQ